MNGTLFLIPTPLGENFSSDNFSKDYIEMLSGLKHFIVEEVRTARRFLRKIDPSCNIDKMTFYVLNEHTSEKEYEKHLDITKSGINIGLLSEAGCPGIADPGAQIVHLAHKKGIRVIPFIGPSSITLALMASGLNGQNFSFSGYLPIKSIERKPALQQLEKLSKLGNTTQIFIETPYRNLSLFDDIINSCLPSTLLCIACNINQPDEFIRTMKIADWKNNTPDINKKPVVFLLLSAK
jgi:16S rRNA (cytidine1402-2'-O)-methyltransferase